MHPDTPDHDPVDASVTYVQDMEVFDDAEDVKRVRFSNETTAVEVGITDETMIEFLETAEEVFDSIHADMADLHDELEERARDNEDTE